MNVHLLAQMKTLSVLKMERIAGASFKNGANRWSELLERILKMERIAGINKISVLFIGR